MSGTPSDGAGTPPRRNAEGLRYGWTTGACAAAAAKAASIALHTGAFPEHVTVTLPKGERPRFALARRELGDGVATAGIVKDAGDDPDVTHGALILASVTANPAGRGIDFHAGEGVGTVTKPGLPLPVGEPAINPKPREIIRAALAEAHTECGASEDLAVTVSIPGGEALARETWNPRLGIVGGLSVLGTTGVVVPYSCSAWIDSIHRGVDVARASNTRHIAAAVGATSEGLVQRLYGLPETSLIDMGDFAGGLLKYLRRHPVPRVTLAGGFAKFAKLAQGHLDLHSSRSQVDVAALAVLLEEAGAPETLVARAREANTALDVLTLGQDYDLGARVAEAARMSALAALRGAEIDLEIVVSDREGRLIGRAGP